MSRILIVEDEQHIAAFISRGLTSAGYETVVAEDGAEGLELALGGGVDLVLLDVGLPTMDGFEVLRELRARDTLLPVIMLTARSSTSDTVQGLDAGASDYMSKPFTFEELVARVRSRLRESATTANVSITQGDVVLDVLARRATVNGVEIELSTREFTLAEQFLRNPGDVLTREQLLSRVWGMDFDPGSNVVDVYVRYLRAKLGPQHIVTVRGVGYRWE